MPKGWRVKEHGGKDYRPAYLPLCWLLTESMGRVDAEATDHMTAFRDAVFELVCAMESAKRAEEE